MDKSKASCSLVWIVVVLVTMILSCIIALAYGEKVFVGCSAGVYVAESDPNVDQLHFTQILGLNPRGITHDPMNGMLYIIQSSTRILKANQDGSGVATVLDLTGEYPWGIHIEKNDIFWTDYLADTVNRVNINNHTDTKVIATNADYCLGITGHNSSIYWAEANTHTVKKAAIDGSGVTTIISGLTNAAAVTVDKAGQVGWIVEIEAGLELGAKI
ncbi:low-density lipoprotein receptor-related protein 2-like [Amphiura filiformis]|uniref:low-density lipoprotein receptor-related protein 2-like n=1 Tax=Amphiura filiformis TaxID=82378 RepID=UPI003B212DF7